MKYFSFPIDAEHIAEGLIPTIRNTSKAIGLSEYEFIGLMDTDYIFDGGEESVTGVELFFTPEETWYTEDNIKKMTKEGWDYWDYSK